MKNFIDVSATIPPTHGQKWSSLSTQRSFSRQCRERSGRQMLQVLHHLGNPLGWQTKTSMRSMSERRGPGCARGVHGLDSVEAEEALEELDEELEEKTAETVLGSVGWDGRFFK